MRSAGGAEIMLPMHMCHDELKWDAQERGSQVTLLEHCKEPRGEAHLYGGPQEPETDGEQPEMVKEMRNNGQVSEWGVLHGDVSHLPQ